MAAAPRPSPVSIRLTEADQAAVTDYAQAHGLTPHAAHLELLRRGLDAKSPDDVRALARALRRAAKILEER